MSASISPNELWTEVEADEREEADHKMRQILNQNVKGTDIKWRNGDAQKSGLEIHRSESYENTQ